MSPTSNEDLDRWLSQEAPEDVLEPDLPIVDPHHHRKSDLRKSFDHSLDGRGLNVLPTRDDQLIPPTRDDESARFVYAPPVSGAVRSGPRRLPHIAR